MDDITDHLIEFAAEVVFLTVSAFVIMIALGAAHSHYDGIPPLSFLTVGWLLVVVRFVTLVATAPLLKDA